MTNNSAGFWITHSGTTPALVTNYPTMGNPNNKVLQVAQSQSEDVHALFSGGASFGTSGTDVLYVSFTLVLTNLPGATTTYFSHFYQDSSTFKAKLFVMTNGVTPGAYHIGILNSGNPTQTTPSYPQDLLPGVSYTIVASYTPSTGASTLWVNPSSVSSTSLAASDATSTGTIVGYAFRQASPEGIVYIDNLLVGTSFADVVSSGPVGPTIITQPQDANVFVGNNASFTSLAAGDAPLTYQWYYNTNTVLTGETNATLTVSNVTTLSAGTYSAIASNNVSTASTRYAVLTVSSTPIPPVITNQPVNLAVNAGDTATFTVVAGGSPTLVYQWNSIIGGVTNIITNAVSSTLTLSSVTTSLAGQYFVTITNSFGSTNSTLATLTVSPPPVLSIAQLRSMVNSSFAPTNTTTAYTITGTVTTWTNMTTSTTSTEFYMQDNSGGIVVFWSGAAPNTSLPPAGALVQVTGPLAAFNGLLEIEPVLSNPLHNVTVLSTNNPLPAAMSLPFDPNVTGNLAAMKNFEGMYFVASNVMLNLSASAFASSANDTITNNAYNVLSATNSAATL
ncbi:MAG TPA: immunoglobulin domain-containing protein, partial [Verrucomicrobiae bacterium]